MTEQLVKSWNGSALVNSVKFTHTFDNNLNNNMTEYLFKKWDRTSWVDTSRNVYSYDQNNNNTEFLIQNWDGSAWVIAI